jgi:hypothetical protein
MKRKPLSLLVLTTVMGVLVLGRDAAAQRVEADANKEYVIFPEVGSWVVLVATYAGPDAQSLARQMVYKIRAELNYTAYVFAYVDKAAQEQQEEFDRVNKFAEEMMKQSGAVPVRLRKKSVRVERHYGVFVGGWNTIKEANTACKTIREIEKPPDIRSASGATGYDTCIVMMRDSNGKPMVDADGEPKYMRGMMNPFWTAMVTRNPSLQHQQPVMRQADPALKKFNAEEEYSLLNCKGNYTLLVKDYTGTTILQNTSGTSNGGFMAALGLGGNKPGDGLAAAAHDAHELARTLRQLNFDAYVLHGRTGSSVTIGSFVRQDDEAMQRVAQQLAQLKERMLAQIKSDPMQLYWPPRIVDVPKP